MTPDLRTFDVILVNSSAGKDSQAMLDLVVSECDLWGLGRSRIVVVHADLGRMEWPGTRELAEEQARHYGVRFEVVSRIGKIKRGSQGELYREGETFGDLLDYVKRRGRWPDSRNRFCTSDFKRAPIRQLITKLHAEARGCVPATHAGVFRLLNCLGMRAEESPNRRKMRPLVLGAAPGRDTREGLSRSRHVETWLPLHDWTTEQVWERIKASGVRCHPAYDLGMKRLSCRLCIFAPESALMLAGSHARDLLADYVATEEAIGHTFRHKFRLAVVQERLEAGEQVKDNTATDDGCWNM